DGDGRVEMPSRNMPDRIGHRQDRQSERECDAQKADAEIGKRRRQDGRAAAAKGEPERTEELGRRSPHEVLVHRFLPFDYSSSENSYDAASAAAEPHPESAADKTSWLGDRSGNRRESA